MKATCHNPDCENAGITITIPPLEGVTVTVVVCGPCGTHLEATP